MILASTMQKDGCRMLRQQVNDHLKVLAPNRLDEINKRDVTGISNHGLPFLHDCWSSDFNTGLLRRGIDSTDVK